MLGDCFSSFLGKFICEVGMSREMLMLLKIPSFCMFACILKANVLYTVTLYTPLVTTLLYLYVAISVYLSITLRSVCHSKDCKPSK